MKNMKEGSKNKPNAEKSKAALPLTMTNYKLMLIGLVIIIIGFILMTGGGSNDPNVFDKSMFSFRRITLAPIIVLAGFAFEIYAIMHRPKKEE